MVVGARDFHEVAFPCSKLSGGTGSGRERGRGGAAHPWRPQPGPPAVGYKRAIDGVKPAEQNWAEVNLMQPIVGLAQPDPLSAQHF